MTADPPEQREVRSFLMARDPSIDRRCRPRPERKVRLFDEIHEETDDDTSSLASFDDVPTTTDGSKGSSVNHDSGDGALVYLRLRPVSMPSDAYTISEAGNVLITYPSSESLSTTTNKNAIEKHYSFSAIFDGEVCQRDVYESCVGHKIEVDERFTVLTYGTSGSGKTFTLLGDDDNPGIIPRTLENLFTLYAANIYPHPFLKLVKARVAILDDAESAKELQLRRKILGNCEDIHMQHARQQQSIRGDHDFQTKQLKDVSVLIWVSFVEIYNEMVYDLLEPPPLNVQTTMAAPSRQNLKIVGNDGKVFIKGLTTVYVKSSLEALQLLRYGQQRVTYASTTINANSSRSHCIFFVDVLKYNRTGVITETSYKFCDLAGSERLVKTRNVGCRLKEAQCINTSLMVLGRCLDAANANRKKNSEIIPYRESKLTMLLQSSLLGKEKLTMIVNVTPTDNYYEENMNVLGFSSIAKNIIFKQPIVKPNNSRFSFFMEQTKLDADTYHARNEYVEQLLEENICLRSELERVSSEYEITCNSHLSEIDILTSQHNSELMQQENDLRNALVDSFQKTLHDNRIQFDNRLQQELESQKRIYEAKIAALKRKYESEIEDLREEQEEQNESSKKRRTVD